jgi:hypothetical protein
MLPLNYHSQNLPSTTPHYHSQTTLLRDAYNNNFIHPNEKEKKPSMVDLLALTVGGLILAATLKQPQTEPKIMAHISAMLMGAGLCFLGITSLVTYNILKAGGFFTPERDLKNIIKNVQI